MGSVGPSRGLLVALFFFSAAITWPAAAIGGQLNLTWLATSSDALGFSVERSLGIASPFAIVATTGPGVTSYADVSVADATTYCYRVQAFNSVAYSEFSYPACGTTAPAALTLALNINQELFAVGDHFQLDVTFAQVGSVALVDVYLGSVLSADPALGCPNGDAAVYVVDPPAGLNGLVFTCASGEASSAVPLYSSAPVGALPALMGANFFGFDWPLTTAGDYTIFMTVTQAGTLNVIAQGTATITYSP